MWMSMERPVRSRNEVNVPMAMLHPIVMVVVCVHARRHTEGPREGGDAKHDEERAQPTLDAAPDARGDSEPKQQRHEPEEDDHGGVANAELEADCDGVAKSRAVWQGRGNCERVVSGNAGDKPGRERNEKEWQLGRHSNSRVYAHSVGRAQPVIPG